MSQVSIVKCESYNTSEVESAVSKSLELIGGIKKFIKPNSKVLLKVNILSASEPEKAITTHPEIVKAVAKEVIKSGATPFIGDCPGDTNANIEDVYIKTGIKKIADELGIEIINLNSKGVKEIITGDRTIDPLYVSKVVAETDAIINMPKLKTHELTLMTCAIKNMFGIVPGFHKGRFHALTPSPFLFANTLVEIFKVKIPNINIVDAVVGMEGNGPSMGDPRKIGLIIASSDAVAVDAVCSKIINFEPEDIDTTKIAYRNDLGEMHLNKIEILGDKMTTITDFKKTFSIYRKMKNMPKYILRHSDIILPFLKVKPKINKKKCTKCMVCVKNCPKQVIDPKSFKIDHKNCIMCFCCRELCKYDAVDLTKNKFIVWLVQRLRR